MINESSYTNCSTANLFSNESTYISHTASLLMYMKGDHSCIADVKATNQHIPVWLALSGRAAAVVVCVCVCGGGGGGG